MTGTKIDENPGQPIIDDLLSHEPASWLTRDPERPLAGILEEPELRRFASEYSQAPKQITLAPLQGEQVILSFGVFPTNSIQDLQQMLQQPGYMDKNRAKDLAKWLHRGDNLALVPAGTYGTEIRQADESYIPVPKEYFILVRYTADGPIEQPVDIHHKIDLTGELRPPDGCDPLEYFRQAALIALHREEKEKVGAAIAAHLSRDDIPGLTEMLSDSRLQDAVAGGLAGLINGDDLDAVRACITAGLRISDDNWVYGYAPGVRGSALGEAIAAGGIPALRELFQTLEERGEHYPGRGDKAKNLMCLAALRGCFSSSSADQLLNGLLTAEGLDAELYARAFADRVQSSRTRHQVPETFPKMLEALEHFKNDPVVAAELCSSIGLLNRELDISPAAALLSEIALRESGPQDDAWLNAKTAAVLALMDADHQAAEPVKQQLAAAGGPIAEAIAWKEKARRLTF